MASSLPPARSAMCASNSAWANSSTAATGKAPQFASAPKLPKAHGGMPSAVLPCTVIFFRNCPRDVKLAAAVPVFPKRTAATPRAKCQIENQYKSANSGGLSSFMRSASRQNASSVNNRCTANRDAGKAVSNMCGSWARCLATVSKRADAEAAQTKLPCTRQSHVSVSRLCMGYTCRGISEASKFMRSLKALPPECTSVWKAMCTVCGAPGKSEGRAFA
mmetsp:Transcript_93687/g.303344  ORF Transcript_93687/g.303344 Transcript_93687/m.303344 type:complete len:219 (+) Transcript_93687:555-1211(+)